MTFDRFAEIIAREFGMEIGAVNSDLKIVDDLEWDSLELLRLMLVVEAMCPGFELPEQLPLADIALGDVHHYMERYLERQDYG